MHLLNLSAQCGQPAHVLVTGGAGSIGAAVARRLLHGDTPLLSILDHCDHQLLEITEELQSINPSARINRILCDIRDPSALTSIMSRLRPDVVLHAAALKHVHLGEEHPEECLLTNLVGAHNVLNAASAAGVKKLTFVSTDKAAAPGCMMGATKRLAELHLGWWTAMNDAAMTVRAVRFGNVLGSRGSVLPRFESQIAAGGPVTITHADMTRYFMSYTDAVDLIIEVTELDNLPEVLPGGAFYRDMGEPVSIAQLAKDLIARSGREVEIKITGCRPGEKLSEQLCDRYERVRVFGSARLKVTEPRSGDLVSAADVQSLAKLARTRDGETLRREAFALMERRLGADMAISV